MGCARSESRPAARPIASSIARGLRFAMTVDVDASSPGRIRPARPDDVAVIAAFNGAMALETEGKRLDPDTLLAGVAAVFERQDRGVYRVAEIDGEVVACLLVTYEWSDWRNANWWWLQSVYVLPAHRGKGLFARMYRELRAMAMATPGVCGLRLYVETENRRAQAVYEQLGMVTESYRMYTEPFR